MTFIKIGILALTPFILMPVMSEHFKTEDLSTIRASTADIQALVKSANIRGSVHYKTGPDHIDLPKQQKLPARPYPPLPEPYPQV